MLMAVGADWTLQNEQGWSALQEAICSRQEGIAMIIVRYNGIVGWARWCRRLPRLIGTMRRIGDFYMEITFHFESSVIPFISRIAPSDTYKIWKRGSNLRADMTLAGFDGFRIQRLDQSFLFLGDKSEDGKVPPGSAYLILHKDKEILNVSDFNGSNIPEAEIKHLVMAMSRTKIFRPRIDVTQAVLSPQLTLRGEEKTKMVGPWEAKVYDMQHVVLSVKSQWVPGAMEADKNDTESEGYEDLLTEDERKELEAALKLDSSEMVDDGLSDEPRDIPIEDKHSRSNGKAKHDRKGWFGNWGKWGSKNESEYKKGLRPVLWLSPDFPLRIEELLPVLDIVGHKVKAVRPLRELLTTKIPAGTFPVKVAISVVPTIRVLVTFTKFEELQPEEEFSTPPSSPMNSRAVGQESPAMQNSNSWIQWLKAPYRQSSSMISGPSKCAEDIQDPFMIPPDYHCITFEDMMKKMKEKGKSKKGKGHGQLDSKTLREQNTLVWNCR
ncbi:uncharacterized protein LOC143851968 isoform X2 [Tasmannia lanceolata]